MSKVHRFGKIRTATTSTWHHANEASLQNAKLTGALLAQAKHKLNRAQRRIVYALQSRGRK